LCQKPLLNASVFEALWELDKRLAEEAQRTGCPRDGGRLDRADYPRKPRGQAGLGRGYQRRFSFCCRERGCRQRVTPPSVRFLGRRVYLAAVVVLASVLRQGATPWRARRLKELCGVSAKTLRRWEQGWPEQVLEPGGELRTVARLAELVVPQGAAARSLLEAFYAEAEAPLCQVLLLRRSATPSRSETSAEDVD